MQYATRLQHPAIPILLILIINSTTSARAEEMPGREIMDEISRHHEMFGAVLKAHAKRI